ncbi:unnamed protein product [Notodromas monacha]|uniref:39S ribosomal protein L20, mitochondrial n=1 Tax=Notodromas monacha TaxID=399045 RepID=A0A7R9GDB3_9CRUS|nr:unnamed protein product [Notodromas monacha]CAG0918503.1 unnamed protein product [Notodromas monacha]
MVLTSLVLYSRVNLKANVWYDKYWRRRQLFLHSAHFFRRARNIYKLAIRRFRRSMVNATKMRPLKRTDMRELNTARIMAACEELNAPYDGFMEGLARADVALDRKTLAHLANWEPRTFKGLVSVSSGLNDALVCPPPEGVITRGML